MSKNIELNSRHRIGLFAGSFDPITNGHLDIIAKASSLFDSLVIGVGSNISKNGLFSITERVSMVQESCRTWPNVQVKDYEGLTVELAKKVQAQVLIRGLRSGEEAHYEMTMAEMNRQLDPNIQTIFIPANPIFFHISSTLVKDIARHGGNLEALVPKSVIFKFKEKYGR